MFGLYAMKIEFGKGDTLVGFEYFTAEKRRRC